jgi:hypothetical protein
MVSYLSIHEAGHGSYNQSRNKRRRELKEKTKANEDGYTS